MEAVAMIVLIVLIFVAVSNVRKEEREREIEELREQERRIAFQEVKTAVQNEVETRNQIIARIETNPVYQTILSKLVCYVDGRIKTAQTKKISSSENDILVIRIYADGVGLSSNKERWYVWSPLKDSFQFWFYEEYGMDNLDFESGLIFFQLIYKFLSEHYQNSISMYPNSGEIASRWEKGKVLRENKEYFHQEERWLQQSDHRLSLDITLDFTLLHPKYTSW